MIENTRWADTTHFNLPRDACGTPRRNPLPKLLRNGLVGMDAAALVHAATLNLVYEFREEGISLCFTRY